MQKLLESKVIGRDLNPKLYTHGHVMNSLNTMTRQASDFKVFFQYPYPLLHDKNNIRTTLLWNIFERAMA